ncbi:Distal membrane-arm assembly complex protein 2 [Merluccius polli]|uniref:Distal membrane-arm assembly complex protein 2 n=1 Tax=Merluccius polli TaxID=89951 RepID=A0AA47MME3_MERPO|nr:Distal membrane-arm assembly complex protein 2 [Merluccius polli]
MAAPLMSLQRCCKQASLHLCVRRRLWSGSAATPPSVYKRLLLALTQRFYDVEFLLNWRSQLKSKALKKKNAYYHFTKEQYGENIASAYFVLNMKGAFRYAGQSEWFRSDSRGKFSWDFVNHKDSALEEVDMSHTVINQIGLANLVGNPLRTLTLRGCHEVDDWALARLHVFQDTLEELDISYCPHITIGGLAALRNLKGLRRLNVSSLPRLSSPGLVIILLEEMLPRCQVTAMGYDLSFTQVGGNEEEEGRELRGR